MDLTSCGMGGYGTFYYTSSATLEVSLVVLVTFVSLIYLFFVYFKKRRDHTKHVRTGSLKSTHTTQTSPSVSRKVSTLVPLSGNVMQYA